jgi:protein-tyrosine-phosphatase
MSAPRRRVLVICTGNICRSPMGEAFLRGISRRAAWAT